MPVVKLTDRFVKSAKPREGERRSEFFDEETKGLSLRVSEADASWWFHFTNPVDDLRARCKLGGYPQTSLAGARTKAIEAGGHVEEGKDPRVVLAEQSAEGMTVKALIKAYLTKRVPSAGKGPRKGQPLKTAKAIERRLNKNVLPIIGNVRLADLHKRDMTQVMDPIKERGALSEAARCFEDIRAMVRWAVSEGTLDRNPLEGMQKPEPPKSDKRALGPDEIRTLWNGLPTALPKSKTAQRVIKLLLLTMQRVSEVSEMERAELDLKARLWVIGKERTKNGYEHRVPLSDAAVTIIEEAIADAGDSDYVFPSGDGPHPGHAIAQTITRANEVTEERPQGRFGIAHWSAKSLRTTGSTQMAKLGIPPIVRAHVQNHISVTKSGVTLEAYDAYDYATEKREALDKLAERLDGIIGGTVADIVPMHRKRA